VSQDGGAGAGPASQRINRATRKRTALRRGLASARPVVAVGAHDALSARLIEQRAFDAVWVSSGSPI